jgi:large subunit ribosomal protein L28
VYVSGALATITLCDSAGTDLDRRMFSAKSLGYLEFVMAQVCKICGKGPQFGNKISHAHNVSKRRWNVNLRPVKAEVNGGSKRIRVCTRCIKAGKIVKA